MKYSVCAKIGGIKMSAEGGMGIGFTIVWMVVLFGIMYFLMIRPQKKEQKRIQALSLIHI